MKMADLGNRNPPSNEPAPRSSVAGAAWPNATGLIASDAGVTAGFSGTTDSTAAVGAGGVAGGVERDEAEEKAQKYDRPFHDARYPHQLLWMI